MSSSSSSTTDKKSKSVKKSSTESSNNKKSKSVEEEVGTVFVFYSKSKDVLPGEGTGEHINSGDKKKYKKLASIENWRKRLSNFDESSFKEDGKTWNSVEHYYQASKFKKNNKGFYNKFSAEANTDISRDPNKAKAAGSKSGKYKGKRIRPDDIQADPDFFKGRDVKVMNKAQEAKFFTHPDLMKLLKATKDAKLVHTTKINGEGVVFQHLMDIRDGKVKRKSEPEEIVLTSKVSVASSVKSGSKFPEKIPKEVKFSLPSLEYPLAGHFIPELFKKKDWNEIYGGFENFEDYGIEGDVYTFYKTHNIELLPSISLEDRKKIPKIVMAYDKSFNVRRIDPKTGSGQRKYTLAEMKEFVAVKHVRIPFGVRTADQYREFIIANVKLFL